MKLFLKILSVAIVLLIAALTIVIANRGESTVTAENPPEETQQAPSPSPSPTPSVTPSPAEGPYNPLSGLPIGEDAVNNRPYAIMLNNIKTAQPLLGISEADILFEIPVEGGITRLMALYQDISDLGKIGSVRSARPYFIEIAQGYDAVYIHAGGSPKAYELLKATGIAHLDGVNGSKQDIFFRDAQRKKTMGYEHSLVTSGELMSKFLPTYGIKLAYDAAYDAGMTFADSAAPAAGLDAFGVTVHFSSGKKTAFEFTEETGLYGVSQYGREYVDGNTGEQLQVTNVLVLRTDIFNIAGDTAGRLSVDVTGSGGGVFFCGGKYIPVTWSKESAASPFVFTTEDGAPLVFGRGITYICIIDKNNAVDIT